MSGRPLATTYLDMRWNLDWAMRYEDGDMRDIDGDRPQVVGDPGPRQLASQVDRHVLGQLGHPSEVGAQVEGIDLAVHDLLGEGVWLGVRVGAAPAAEHDSARPPKVTRPVASGRVRDDVKEALHAGGLEDGAFARLSGQVGLARVPRAAARAAVDGRDVLGPALFARDHQGELCHAAVDIHAPHVWLGQPGPPILDQDRQLVQRRDCAQHPGVVSAVWAVCRARILPAGSMPHMGSVLHEHEP